MNNNKKPLRKKTTGFLCFFISCLSLISCRLTSDLSEKVWNRSYIRTLKSVPEKNQPPPKRFFKKKSKPSLPIPATMKKLVSITITEEAPLKGAFIELSHQAGVDLQLDPKIRERVIFSASKRPFIKVIEDICDMAGLRHKILGQSVRVEVDTPYPVHYNLSFLNLSRLCENRTSIATDVFSSVKDKQTSADNGSNSAITGKVNNDFWAELESNLKIILTSHSEGIKAFESGPSSYSLHRQGGLVTIYGTAQQHALVARYLESLRQTISTQVLIEAKVIEVSLKDHYKSGINWQKLAGGNFRMDMRFGDLTQKAHFMDPTHSQMEVLSLGFQRQTFSSLLKAIEEFGSSRTLSSPRLTVLNNQTAILKVAQNQVYFRLNYDKRLSLSVDHESINVSSDIQTVPIGLVMSVHPSIDQNTGDIILSLRPTISQLTHSVSDPAVDIALANAQSPTNARMPSLVPVVEVREIDSILRLQSGEIAVLGGLMEARSTQGTSKLPLAGDLPVVGQLFSASTDGDNVVELVVLLRASIIEGTPAPGIADQRLYQHYVDDPRPIGG